MQGAEDEDEGSVLMYVTEARIPKATQQIAFVQQSQIVPLEAWGYALESSYRMVISRVYMSKDLCRGPYSIIRNSLNNIIRTTVSNAQPLLNLPRSLA